MDTTSSDSSTKSSSMIIISSLSIKGFSVPNNSSEFSNSSKLSGKSVSDPASSMISAVLRILSSSSPVSAIVSSSSSSKNPDSSKSSGFSIVSLVFFSGRRVDNSFFTS